MVEFSNYALKLVRQRLLEPLSHEKMVANPAVTRPSGTGNPQLPRRQHVLHGTLSPFMTAVCRYVDCRL